MPVNASTHPQTVVTFRTTAFNVTERKPHFINDGCYGDDLARWMIAELAKQEVVTLGEILRSKAYDEMQSPRDDAKVDYAEVVHPETLVSVGELAGHGVLLAALRIGKLRLIDNRVVAPPGTPAWEA